MDRPNLSFEEFAGSKNRTKKTKTTKTLKVLNCLFKYAVAPSCTAAAIFFILSVPSPAARTSLTK